MRRIGLAVTLALAVAVPTAGASTIPQRYFSVSVKGVQTTTSTYQHASSGPCDASDTNISSERVVFHSTHSKVVLASYFANLGLVAFGKGRPKESQLPAVFSITHHSQSVHGAVAPSCQGSGGGGTAPPQDCGTRTRRMYTQFSWLNPKGIQLEIPDFAPYGQPFRNCTVGGAIFPQLLDQDTQGRPIYAHVPPAELFDHAWREHILVGSGTLTSPDGEGGYTTKIRWEVKLRAVPPPWNRHAKVY